MDYTWYWTLTQVNWDGSLIGIMCAVPVLSSKKSWSICGSKINIIEAMQHNTDKMTHCENCKNRMIQ